MKVKVLILSILLASSSFGSFIDPRQPPPINKPTTKPYIHKKFKKVMIAVIDTGLDPGLMTDPSICPDGHKDFTGTGMQDGHGHGTHISGIIDQYAKNIFLSKEENNGEALTKAKIDYCQIIIKYYDPKTSGKDNLAKTVLALRFAIDSGVDIINYSSGGEEPNEQERELILEALDKGIKVVAAAGNESNDIDKVKYYPAMYDKRIYIVGNLVDKQSRKVAESSNRGKSVNTWEVGEKVYSRLPGSYGYNSGTSQAAAAKSGKLIREMLQLK